MPNCNCTKSIDLEPDTVQCIVFLFSLKAPFCFLLQLQYFTQPVSCGYENMSQGIQFNYCVKPFDILINIFNDIALCMVNIDRFIRMTSKSKYTNCI